MKAALKMFENVIRLMLFVFFNNSGCIEALGMTRGTITDTQITASSELDNTHSAAQARLHSKANGSKYQAWSAHENDHHQWLQIDFGSSTKITRLATQGRNGFNEWVTKYNLSYSDDGVHFHSYKMMGESRAKVYQQTELQFGILTLYKLVLDAAVVRRQLSYYAFQQS